MNTQRPKKNAWLLILQYCIGTGSIANTYFSVLVTDFYSNTNIQYFYGAEWQNSYINRSLARIQKYKLLFVDQEKAEDLVMFGC